MILDTAELFERMASGVDSNLLPTSAQPGSVPGMNDAHRMSLSAARAPDDKLHGAVRAAGYPSLNAFAKDKKVKPVIRVSVSLLRAAHKGERPINESVCERVRDLLGKDPETGDWRMPADESAWPRMRRGK